MILHPMIYGIELLYTEVDALVLYAVLGAGDSTAVASSLVAYLVEDHSV